jgi:hypothetical protein
MKSNNNLFFNSKKALSMSIQKVITLIIILFVLMLVSFKAGEDANSFESFLFDFKLNTLKEKCEISEPNCNIVVCSEDIENTCTDAEKSMWVSLERYNNYCSKNSGFDLLPEDYDRLECGVLFEKIGKATNLNLVPGEYNSDIFKLSVDFKELNLDNCKDISKSFSISSLDKTPYWVTISGETGQVNFKKKLNQIVRGDTGGSHSYGHFGLNSGTAQIFWNLNKNLGLVGIPNSKEADDSWLKVSSENPDGLLLAEIEWYNSHIIARVIKHLKSIEKDSSVYENPIIIAYLSDVTIQEGFGSMRTLVKTVDEPNFFKSLFGDSYLEKLANYQGSDDYLNKKFKTYLSENPNALGGLKKRIKNRLDLSSQVVTLRVTEDLVTTCE